MARSAAAGAALAYTCRSVPPFLPRSQEPPHGLLSTQSRPAASRPMPATRVKRYAPTVPRTAPPSVLR